MRSRWTLVFAFALLAPATAAAAPISSQAGHLRDMEVFIPPSKVNKAEATQPISHIIFLNKCQPQCVISPGQDNATTQTSSIVPGPGPAVLNGFKYSDAVWNKFVACVKEVYLPLDVQIVTTRPASGPYHEDIVAGKSSDLGLPANVGGIATIACTPLNNQISFDFANEDYYQGDPIQMCWTSSQESAHAFSLDHEYDCSDPMTYIPGCGQKFFRNKSFQCAGLNSSGQFVPEPCRCGGSTQNSYQKLVNVFGPGKQPPGPVVSISLPHDGDMVTSGGFPVYFTASDDRGVDHSDLFINGWKYATLPGNSYQNRSDPYKFTTPNLPDGYMHIDVKSYNDMKSVGDAKVTVLKGNPCTSASQCSDGQQCVQGACTWPTPTAQLGDTCVRSQDCVSHVCGTVGSQQLCTESCIPGASQCPDSFKCLPSGNAGACWPNNGSGGGCGCTVGGEPGGSFPLVSLGLFFAAVLVSLGRGRRRRQRARR